MVAAEYELEKIFLTFINVREYELMFRCGPYFQEVATPQFFIYLANTDPSWSSQPQGGSEGSSNQAPLRWTEEHRLATLVLREWQLEVTFALSC